MSYLTFENIYFWSNLGLIPFWLMLIIIPNSSFTQFFVNSIVLPLLLSTAYIFVIKQSILLGDSFLEIFTLYFSLDDLYVLFSTESFLLVFWIHFLGINIFLGSWISRDGVKYNIPRWLVFFPLIVVYLTGPLGLALHWLIRIFYAKKLLFHD